MGAEVITLSAQGPDGAAYPEGTAVSWAVVDGTAAQAVEFTEGSGRLDLVTPLPAGTYQVDISYRTATGDKKQTHTVTVP